MPLAEHASSVRDLDGRLAVNNLRSVAQAALDLASRWSVVARWRAVRYSRLLARTREPELRLLDLLVPGRTFVDVGANIGIYTAHAIGAKASRIIAVEPVPELAVALQKILRSRDLLRLCAMSDRAGFIDLEIPVDDGRERFTRSTIVPVDASGRSVRRIAIETRRLDDEAGLDDCVIKIDVEGAEHLVIAGAEKTLAAGLPAALLVESEERHQPGGTKSLLEQMCSNGYTAWIVTSTHLIPAERFDPDVHQRSADRKIVEAGGSRPMTYSNNLCFVRDELASDFSENLPKVGFRLAV